jgi:DNA-binding transcriptional regulator YhcF (GntR family)
VTTAARPDPLYLRIAGEIRRRIASGDLRAGDRVPSTREITRQWGVAMATATKVLATLRDEGLVRTVAGVGTVVERAPRQPEAAASEHGPRRDRIVHAAVGIADAEGLEAVSMRRLAAQLGVGAMSLYRYVPGKEALVHLMAEAVFRQHPLPEPGPDGWRAPRGTTGSCTTGTPGCRRSSRSPGRC